MVGVMEGGNEIKKHKNCRKNYEVNSRSKKLIDVYSIGSNNVQHKNNNNNTHIAAIAPLPLTMHPRPWT